GVWAFEPTAAIPKPAEQISDSGTDAFILFVYHSRRRLVQLNERVTVKLPKRARVSHVRFTHARWIWIALHRNAAFFANALRYRCSAREEILTFICDRCRFDDRIDVRLLLSSSIP